jgi:hypothetical protein
MNTPHQPNRGTLLMKTIQVIRLSATSRRQMRPTLALGMVTIIALCNCGKVQDASAIADAGATEASAMPQPPGEVQRFEVMKKGINISQTNLTRLNLDFSMGSRVLATTDEQLVDIDYDEVEPPTCDPKRIEMDNKALSGNGFSPKDAGYLKTMTVRLRNESYLPRPVRICFAVHTTDGRWAWRYEPQTFINDYGIADFGRGAGGGHYQIEVNTANVDAVAITGILGETLEKIEYTAIPNR